MKVRLAEGTFADPLQAAVLRPQEIDQLAEFGRLASPITATDNLLIRGRRGSGKTMLLTYLKNSHDCSLDSLRKRILGVAVDFRTLTEVPLRVNPRDSGVLKVFLTRQLSSEVLRAYHQWRPLKEPTERPARGLSFWRRLFSRRKTKPNVSSAGPEGPLEVFMKEAAEHLEVTEKEREEERTSGTTKEIRAGTDALGGRIEAGQTTRTKVVRQVAAIPPSVTSFMRAVEELCAGSGLSHVELLVDEVSYELPQEAGNRDIPSDLHPELQAAFLSLVRDVHRSSRMFFKIAVIPYRTQFPEEFEPGQDANEIELERNERSPDFESFYTRVIGRRIVHRNPEAFRNSTYEDAALQVLTRGAIRDLGLAAMGDLRTFLRLVRESYDLAVAKGKDKVDGHEVNAVVKPIGDRMLDEIQQGRVEGSHLLQKMITYMSKSSGRQRNYFVLNPKYQDKLKDPLDKHWIHYRGLVAPHRRDEVLVELGQNGQLYTLDHSLCEALRFSWQEEIDSRVDIPDAFLDRP